MSYFSVERNGNYLGKITYANIADLDDPRPDFMKMSYDEMKSSEYLEEFIDAIMMDVNEATGITDGPTVVTLINDDDIFIWGILMNYMNDSIRYCLIDWQKDGKKYRYEPLDK